MDLASSVPVKPIQSWSHEEVCAWVGAAEGGRFAHVALPPGLDGAGLMKLGTMRLAQLFDGDLREARGDNEGSAWTEALAGEDVATGRDGLGGAVSPAAALFHLAVLGQFQPSRAWHGLLNLLVVPTVVIIIVVANLSLSLAVSSSVFS